MNTQNFFSNKYIKGGLLVIVGLLLGWLIFHRFAPEEKSATGESASRHEGHNHTKGEEKTIWTCAMHPQIRMDKPGQCPICGMDLIPLQKSDNPVDDQSLEMSEAAMKLAEVQTSVVGKGSAAKELLLYGKIQPDERRLQSQTAHVPGRIEQLLINVTGESVKKGQLIARIYSPELVTAQKELLEALTMQNKYPAVTEAAQEKLRNWKLSGNQIRDIETSGKVTSTFDIYANTSGIVTSRKVNEGDYVGKGAVLFDVADLSKVWAVFDAYESELPWISMSQKVAFTAQSLPGKTFEGTVSFIDPVIDPSTRVARIRVALGNPGLQLKPEMFINGTVKANVRQQGEQLTIPQSAVLWTGTRAVVYVKVPGTEHPAFKMREITLGAATNDSYLVQEGLEEGEEIVTNGTFNVDAAAQLAGKPSMMIPEGGAAPTGHNHGQMTPGPSPAPDGQATSPITQGMVAPGFKAQLTHVYEAYLEMKDAFVASDARQVSLAAKKVSGALQSVDMDLLKGNAHSLWMDQLTAMNRTIAAIGQQKEIEQQRDELMQFSEALYHSIKAFGLESATAYYQYCPMANKEGGAYWLSASKEISNPYLGEEMLECGETKETLQ
jgi:Cu(I)/Ag(I) efflux system membrane fusion protein